MKSIWLCWFLKEELGLQISVSLIHISVKVSVAGLDAAGGQRGSLGFISSAGCKQNMR